MEQEQLYKLAQEIKIAPLNLLREEAEMLVLEAIARSDLPHHLIFYGGTALRLAYNCPRFSEDLDFLQVSPVSERRLELALKYALELDPGMSLEDIKDKRHTLFALLRLKSPFLKHSLSIKIEMSKRENGIHKEFRPLYSPVSVFQPSLFVADLPSLELAKERAVRSRGTARDWFDLWYINKMLRRAVLPEMKFDLDIHEFKREMKRLLPRTQWKLCDQAVKDFK
ncbi:MAG: nucleotidyl transferase AbiEii/AbiGii toxin family protein [bacterium]